MGGGLGHLDLGVTGELSNLAQRRKQFYLRFRRCLEYRERPGMAERPLIRMSDALARRDFVYGVVFLGAHWQPVILVFVGLRDWISSLRLRSGGVGRLMFFHTPIAAAFMLSLRAIYYKALGNPEKQEGLFMKIIRILGVIIGIAIVTLIIHEVGWSKIEYSLGMLGWGYVIVIIYPISWILLNTGGWRMALHAQYARLPLARLAQIRLAGETFNSLLPSGYVGGEPLKAKLLSKWIPMHEAASSVLIAKAAQSVGLVLFVGLGSGIGGPQRSPRSRITPRRLSRSFF